jgi:hypothetical protein
MNVQSLRANLTKTYKVTKAHVQDIPPKTTGFLLSALVSNDS